MRPIKRLLLPFIHVQLCAIAPAVTLPTLGPTQLPSVSLSPNFTFLYDNETFSALPSSNLTFLYDNLTSSSSPSSDFRISSDNATSVGEIQLPPDPIYMRYGFATIMFFGYGANVDVSNAQAVFRDVLIDCGGKNPRGRMGTDTRIYTEGSVGLIFSPEATMYWLTWVHVRDKLVSFSSQHGYPEFGFSITNPRSGTFLGSGSFRIIDSNRLPPDPFNMPFAQGVVKFHQYGPNINKIDATRVISEVLVDCFKHPEPTEVIGRGPKGYTEQSVTLTLNSGRLLTWQQWYGVIELIRAFLTTYEYIGLHFDILNEQAVWVANGVLQGSGH